MRTWQSIDAGKVFKKISFYVIFYCLIPLTFFILLESCLILFNYGYSPDFFIPTKIEGKEYFVNNYKFSWQFFPKSMARLSASVVVPAVKDKDAFRVFVLGESAAMGDPDPAFAFSRMLQVMFEKKYPDKKIEIYNTAITAINSNVLLAIEEDCFKLKPDLFIIYAGNNEVIGPYGLAEALSNFTSQRSIIKSKIWFNQTKTGQLASQLTSNEEVDFQQWRSMEMFMKNSIAHDDPNMEVIYSHYYDNLSEVCNKAAKKGVKVILSTIITNERDCAPFLSMHGKSLEKTSLRQWNEYYKAGILSEERGAYAAAIEAYGKAEELDSDYAELKFRLGKCYLQTGEFQKAKSALSSAQDLDALRFRADNRTNEIIKRVAYSQAENGVLLADSKSYAQQSCEKGLVGNNLLYEHVHLNPKGNFILANAIFQQMENALGLTGSMEVVDLKHCEERLGFTSFDKFRIDALNLQRIQSAPFTNQSTNGTDVKLQEKVVTSSKGEFEGSGKSATDSVYRILTSTYPSDFFFHLNYLKFLFSYSRYPEASAQAELLYELLPYEYLSHINVAVTQQRMKDYKKAEQYFNSAIQINPYSFEGYRDMASLKEEEGEYHHALTYLHKVKASPEELSAFCNRAGIELINKHSKDSAIKYLIYALKLTPNSASTHQNLNNALQQRR